MSSRFPELVQALPDRERRELYEKIIKSLSLDYDRSGHIYPAEVQRTQHVQLVKRDIARMSFAMRFRVWLRRLFTGRDRETCFIDVRVARLRRVISSAGLEESGAGSEFVGPGVASRVYDLYQAAYPVIPLFMHLWGKKEGLRAIIHRLLGTKIPDARNTPEDLLPRGDMEDIFIRTQSKEDIRKELLSRLESYLSGISDEVYAQIESGIIPLYYLRDICMFDYQGFFQNFGYRPGLEPPTEKPSFRRASAQLVLSQLEELYYGVYSAQKVPRRFFVHRELLEDFAGRKPQGAERAPSEEEREAAVENLSGHLRDLHDAVLRFAQKVPLVELIRYHRRNPYYRFMAYAPQLNLREFYRNSMRIEVLSNLDENFPSIREGVVERLIREIFGGPIERFEYLPETTPEPLRKLGLPSLKHVGALNVLHEYVRGPYRRDLQEFLRVLGRMMPTRRKGAANRIVANSSGLQDVEESAVQLDRAFSPDADSGKLFHRIRYSAEKDPTQHRSFRNLMSQTDREIGSLLDRGIEHIDGLRSVLLELSEDVPDALKERYQLYDPTNPNPDALSWKLAEEASKLQKVHTLITQTMAIEEAKS